MSRKTRGRFASTQSQLASTLGIGSRMVRLNLAAGAPARGKHGYDVDDWLAWRAGRPGRRPPLDMTDPDLAESIRRKTAAEARLKEHELGVKRQQFLPREEHERAVREVARVFVTVLERAGPELAVLLAGVKRTAWRETIDGWTAQQRTELVAIARGEKPGGTGGPCAAAQAAGV